MLSIITKFGHKCCAIVTSVIKSQDGKTPLMLAKGQHRETADFIMEYNKEGNKILSRYEHSNGGHVMEEGPYAEIDKVVDRRTRNVSSNHGNPHDVI